MQNHYIINGKFEFHPATSTLQCVDYPERIALLNSPASRCFLLLIKRAGNIVSQEEFMEEVWQKNGIHVSPNAFYQNISILRKGLKKIGLDEEIIVTIPRVGITLSKDCHITKLRAKHIVEVERTYNSESKDRSITRIEQEKLSDLNSTEISYDKKLKKKASNSFPFEIHLEKKFFKLYILPALCILLISSLIMYLMISLYQDEYYYFKGYYRVDSPKNCNVYLSPSVIHSNLENTAVSYTKEFYNNCTEYPWIYVSALPELPRVSVIRCRKKNGDDDICISDYFIMDN
uniref:winged helix-turn-helix domain-containing protein n=1 Tax=Hafnia alvei TaxID=569 RepID=UPI00242DDD91|nr:winged helix-turn-helix domain-containing protein [Hafnia alvei]